MRHAGHRGPFVACLTVAASLAAVACGARIEGPESAIRAYVEAVEAGDWGRAYRTLDAAATDGMTADQFRDYCREHEELVRERAAAIGRALDRGDVRVVADVPVDRVRSVRLEHDGAAWRLAEGVPLATGADTPTASLEQLAAVLDSEQIAQLLELLSEELRARYMTEIGTLVTALDEASGYTLAVYGDTASATVGEITIHLAREGGAWHVSAVEQPYGSGEEYYYEGW